MFPESSSFGVGVGVGLVLLSLEHPRSGSASSIEHVTATTTERLAIIETSVRDMKPAIIDNSVFYSSRTAPTDHTWPWEREESDPGRIPDANLSSASGAAP